MTLLQTAIQYDGSSADIELLKYFNLYPEVKIYIDKWHAPHSGSHAFFI